MVVCAMGAVEWGVHFTAGHHFAMLWDSVLLQNKYICYPNVYSIK